MRNLHCIFIVLLVLLITVNTLAHANTSIPSISSKTLTGKQYVLPKGFEGGLNAIIVSFHPNKQPMVSNPQK